jgi:endonuclease YncB( thermonuclease family)
MDHTQFELSFLTGGDMKKILLLTLSALFLFAVIMLAAEEKAVVTKVYDGDYIKVKMEGKSYKVKLLGSDVPDKKWGTAKNIKDAIKDAEKYVKDLIDNKEIKLVSDKSAGDKNKKGHLLRYVYLGSTLVNAELIKKGYANVSDDTFSKKSTFSGYAKKAEKDKIGIWSDEVKKEGFFSKWFGRNKSEDDSDADAEDVKEEAVSSKETKAAKDTEVKSRTTAKDTDTSWYKSSMASVIVYVTKSGEKFHKKGCPHLTESATKITIKEAKEKGYQPCKTCEPLKDL